MLERTGSQTIELDGLRGVYRDHLRGYVDDDGKIVMEVDHYHPDPEDAWDVDEWDEAKCFLVGRSTRANWKTLFRIGRGLARHGKIMLHQPGEKTMSIACDGATVVTID